MSGYRQGRIAATREELLAELLKADMLLTIKGWPGKSNIADRLTDLFQHWTAERERTQPK